jgi:aminopeptidase N
MTINKVFIVKGEKNIPLTYTYDSLNLRIQLDKMYKAGENYTVYIDYISRPDDHVWPTGLDKGMYFINPRGEDKNKPTQIWTFGEPQHNSTWYPTIDRPNQKTTSELALTVPSKYLTLSNGLMTGQKMNADGTRTDTWKLDLPFAPYLLYFGVGEYAIVKDSYKGKEVNYYVEKEYASVAKRIFGLTPEMMGFFSKITGVEYAWPKYDQITGRDFVAGAQENVTATLHAEGAQQDARELSDENGWEFIVAHELFHHWFGDLVTCESWANITLNESFANYSETMWYQYKYGKEEGDRINNSDMRTYLRDPADTAKDLVRFYYSDPQDVFDNVSYPKGGRILHMLRNYVGDSAFFKSLNLYLTQNRFKSAEVNNLRLAFEEVTGQDLNWFFNQWYYNDGHPRLDISYAYDAATKTAKLYMTQLQSGKPFKLPFAIDVYAGGNKTRHNVWMNDASDTFSFVVPSKPDLINVDGDKILLCVKKDHKSLDEFIFQYKNAGLYLDKREAVIFAAKNQTDPKSLDLMKTALNDEFWAIRALTLDNLDIDNDTVKRAVQADLLAIAEKDARRTNQAKAIELLGKYKDPKYKSLFVKAVTDSSYTVAGNALQALALIDEAAAETEAKKILNQPAKGALREALYGYTDESKFDSLAASFAGIPVGNAKFNLVPAFTTFLGGVGNTANLEKGVDLIIQFRNAIPDQYHGNTDPLIYGSLQKLEAKKQKLGLKDQADYIKSKLPAVKN